MKLSIAYAETQILLKFAHITMEIHITLNVCCNSLYLTKFSHGKFTFHTAVM
jgi:hypothetical protein